MVVNRQLPTDHVDLLFGALADATRRDILARVMEGDASVSELAARYDMSFAAVQKHVAVLERAQLVTKQKAGREQRVTGNGDLLRRVNLLLGEFEQRWRARVDRLDELFTSTDEGAQHAGGRHSQGHPGVDHDGRRPVRRARRAGLGRLR